MRAIAIPYPQHQLLVKYQRLFDSTIALLTNAKKGLKAEAVFDFMSFSHRTPADVESLLNKTVKTFQNYRQNNTLLDPTTGEKLLKLFALYELGITVFGNQDHFNQWLSSRIVAMGNEVPNNLLDTITGIGLVSDELNRIAYGDLA